MSNSIATIEIAYWLPLTLFLILAVALWRLRRRRYGTGRCARCGYDLRATPDICPECGTVSAPRGRPAAVH